MDTAEELVEPWLARRTAILNKYTTSEKLSIVTSFLPGGEKGIFFFLTNRVGKANKVQIETNLSVLQLVLLKFNQVAELWIKYERDWSSWTILKKDRLDKC